MSVVEAPRKRRGGRPTSSGAFTIEHFIRWASELVLEDGEPWEIENYQAAFVEDYFGGRSYAGGLQREFWWILPEGNGKTTTLAGLGTYVVEHRPRAAVLWAASARDQAEIGFRQAELLVSGSARLSRKIVCQEGYRRVKCKESGGRMQIFASDDGHADGVIPTDWFLDELHRHKSLRLYRTWQGKSGKRNGQGATISTAGEPGTEFEETRERIRQGASEVTRDGSHARYISGTVCMHEWAVPEDGDVEDMRVVKDANPFSGISETLLREKFESPTMTLAHWRRFSCNLPTRSITAAVTEREWFEAATALEHWPAEGQPIFGAGLDVGWVKDTTALVPFHARGPEDRLLGSPTILDPAKDGTQLHPAQIQSALLDLYDRHPFQILVMDTHNAMDIAAWAADELGCEVLDRKQTNAFAVADYQFFMEALRNGWLRHANDPVLNQHVLNAVAQVLPGGDRRFNRPTQSRGDLGQQSVRVIDGLTAAVMVHALYASELATPKQPSAWRPLVAEVPAA